MNEKRYLGKVCVKHPELLGERYNAARNCVGCATDRNATPERKEYMVGYGAEYAKTSKRKAKVAEYARTAKCKAKQAEYVKAHCRKEYQAEYAKTPKRKAVIAKNRAANDPNRSRVRKIVVTLRTPTWADLDKIREVYKEARKQGLSVDHYYPLQGKVVSGLHVHNNLQLLSKSENSSKGNKYVDTSLI